MTAKEIYESIDLGQVPAELADKLRKVEKATKGFSVQSDKVDTFMKGVYGQLKEKRPRALKNLKVEEKITKQEVKVGNKTEVVENLEYKVKGTKRVSKKTPTPSKPARKENVQQEAKRTRKKGELAKDSLARVMKERAAAKEAADKVVTKTSEALKNIEQMLANDPKLAGYPRTYGKQSKRIDANKDAKIKAQPAGKRVSKKGHMNQYGPSKGGRVYWENRDNRSDRYAPNFPNKVFLEVGGDINDLGFPSGHTYLVVEVSPSGDKKLIKSTRDYLTALMSAAVSRSAKSTKDARVLIIDKEDKKVLHETFEAGGEIVVTPYPLVNNPDALVGTTTMTELFECGGVTAYQEGGEVFVAEYPLTNAGSADYVAGSNTMSNMFEKGGYIAMYNGKRAEIDADTLFEAKKKAIQELKVPKSKQGLLSVMANQAMDNEDFRFMANGGKLPKNIKYYGTYDIKEWRLKNGEKIDPSETFVHSGIYVSTTKRTKPQEMEFQQKLEFKKGGATNWKGEKIDWKKDYRYIPVYEIEEVELENGEVIKGDYIVSGLYLPKSDRTKLLEREMKARMKKGKFEVDDLVYNKKTKTIGIVRLGDDKFGEVKTDADGNVGVDDLEIFDPKKSSHSKAKVAPSTEKEINSRGLFNPFKGKFEQGGRLGFEGLAKKVAKRYVGQEVPSKYRKEYGKVYSQEEAMEVGRKVAAKVYGQQQAKMEMGGEITQPYPLTDAGSAEYVAGSNTMSNMFAHGGVLENKYGNRGAEIFKVSKQYSSDKKQIISDDYNLLNEVNRKEFNNEGLIEKYGNSSAYVLYEPKSMAKGGSLMGHGLRVGDKIVKDLGSVLKVENEDGDIVYVDLSDGYRGADVPLPFEKGGSIPSLAKRYNKSLNDIMKKISEGETIEMEHTDNPKVARKIALDHISEDFDYYTKLKKLGL